MEKIMDTLAQMVDGKEWNDESDGLFALSGSIDVEALIMQAANAFITYTEREEEKKHKEARS